MIKFLIATPIYLAAFIAVAWIGHMLLAPAAMIIFGMLAVTVAYGIAAERIIRPTANPTS